MKKDKEQLIRRGLLLLQKELEYRIEIYDENTCAGKQYREDLRTIKENEHVEEKQSNNAHH